MKKTTATKHPATLSTAPRRYIAVAYTAAKVAADLAAKDAGKASRKAATADRAARKLEKCAAILNTAEAVAEAEAARAAAVLAATEAANATATAATLAADPAAYIVIFTLEARTATEAHTAAAVKFEAAAARGMLAPAATIRAYLDPRAALEARAAMEAPRAALEAARRAYTEATEAAEADPTEARELVKAEAAAKVAEARRAVVAADLAAEAAEAVALAEAPETVARQVAKKATEREGTPQQWKIRREAEAREHFAPDFFDMISAAREAFSAILYGSEAEAADLEAKAAATLATAGDPDPHTRESITRGDLAEARRNIRTAAAIREKAADPAAPFWILTAYRAAFLAVNDHLTACRAIRTAEAPAPLSFDDIDPADPAFIVDFDPEAEKEALARAATLRAAFSKVAATLSPTRRRVWILAGKGYTPEAIAAKMRRAHSTICEHLHIIRTAAAAILKAEAPDLAAAILAADLLEAADLEAVKREAAKREAAEATAKATEAARRAVLKGDPEAPEAKEAAEAAEAATKAAEAADLEAATAPATTAAATLAAAVAALSPIRREIWTRLAKGQSGREIAREMRRNEATTREHIKAIRAALAAAMEATAPDLAEALKAADLAAVAAAIA